MFSKIEFMDWLNLSLTGNQLRVSNSFLEIWVILSSCRQYWMHLFCVIWILFLIFWVRLGYQADNVQSKWGWIRALHNNLHYTISLEFIWLIPFRAIDSPDIVSSNMQPVYVTFECCFILYFCIWFLVLEPSLFYV